MRSGRAVAVVVAVLLVLWIGIPAGRVARLVLFHVSQPYPAHPSGLPVQPVHFRAADGVRLSGWLVPASFASGTVILVPGFQDDRGGMIPYARMLHRARFTVLLYDSRGTGASGGRFGFGLGEVGDVLGAVRYVGSRPTRSRGGTGVLGVSLGSGDAIVAGVRAPSVRAIVADSPYANQDRFFEGLDHLSLHFVSVPLAPIARPLAEVITGRSVASFSPLDAARHLDKRSLLLIHSRDDRNPTTPLSDTLALRRAAGGRAQVWIAPRGGHAGALAAQPARYARHVVSFLRTALGT